MNKELVALVVGGLCFVVGVDGATARGLENSPSIETAHRLAPECPRAAGGEAHTELTRGVGRWRDSLCVDDLVAGPAGVGGVPDGGAASPAREQGHVVAPEYGKGLERGCGARTRYKRRQDA